MRKIKQHTCSDVIIYWFKNGLMNIGIRAKTKLTRRERKAIAMARGLKAKGSQTFPSCALQQILKCRQHFI